MRPLIIQYIHILGSDQVCITALVNCKTLAV